MLRMTIKLPQQPELKDDEVLEGDQLQEVVHALKNAMDTPLMELKNGKFAGQDLSDSIKQSPAFGLLIIGNSFYEFVKNSFDAKASQIQLTIDEQHNTVLCTLEDDGHGIDLNSPLLHGEKERSYQKTIAECRSNDTPLTSKKRRDKQLGGSGLGLKIGYLFLKKASNGLGDLLTGNRYDDHDNIMGARITLNSPAAAPNEDNKDKHARLYQFLLSQESSQFNDITDEEAKKDVDDILSTISLRRFSFSASLTPNNSTTNNTDGSPSTSSQDFSHDSASNGENLLESLLADDAPKLKRARSNSCPCNGFSIFSSSPKPEETQPLLKTISLANLPTPPTPGMFRR